MIHVLQAVTGNVEIYVLLDILKTLGVVGIGTFMGRVSARLSNIEKRIERLEE